MTPIKEKKRLCCPRCACVQMTGNPLHKEFKCRRYMELGEGGVNKRLDGKQEATC